MKKGKKQSSILLLLRLAKPEKVRLSGAAILVLFGSFFSMVPFYISYLIIEKVLAQTFTWSNLRILGLWAGGAIFLQMICWGLAMRQAHVAAYGILFQLRVDLSRKLSRLPLGFFEKTNSGFLKKIMMGDIEAIEEFIAHHLVDLLSIIFIPILIFSWLVTIHWPLALLSVLPVFMGFALQRFRMWKEAETVHALFKLKAQMNRTILEFIKGMPVIKAFNQSVFSFQKYQQEAEAYYKHWILMNRKGAGYFALYALMMDSGIVLLLPLTAWLYLRGSFSLSALLVFLFVGLGLTRYMKQLTQFGSNITQIAKGAEILQDLMNEKEMEDKGSLNELENYDVEFSSVSFGYGTKQVLHDISFEIQQGTVTALTGDSGSGKTTIGRLISRFWDVNQGCVKIGGIDVRAISSDFLMEKVSFVFQDVFLFNDTILENIRMGDASLSLENVMEIAKQAQCHEFIMRLPNGYETIIGARGTYLSGGEKQRVSIARAMAKNAPILVLDEATSYADTENEEKIQEALSHLLRNKTVLIIAHRLSTIQNVDQILVLKEGRILERGTHKELLEMNASYAKMWQMHVDALQWNAWNNSKVG